MHRAVSLGQLVFIWCAPGFRPTKKEKAECKMQHLQRCSLRTVVLLASSLASRV